MNNLLKKICTLCILCYTSVSFAQKTDVYTQIPSEHIRISASSVQRGFSATSIIDGSGMKGESHESNYAGTNMWVSEISTQKTRANQHTPEGVVWLMLELDPEPRVDLIQLWNYNQHEFTNRGLKKVYLTYSSDGKTWKTIDDGKNDYHILNKSKCSVLEPANYSLKVAGLKMKYLCITADLNEGNYYHDNNFVTADAGGSDQDVIIGLNLKQHIDMYGLSEIRLYRKETKPLSSLEKVTDMDLIVSQGYLKTPAGPSREYEVSFGTPLYAGGKLFVACNGKQWEETVMPDPLGVYSVKGLFPAGYMDESTQVNIRLKSGQSTFDKTFDVPGARKWTFYFLPHSHQDIGFTHKQEDVMKQQWRNLERAIDLAEQTAAYPEGAQFKWNTEATWFVRGYFDEYKGTEKEKKLIQAIQKGAICVDASLGSILTGISKQEELMHIFDDAHFISQQTGVEVNTTMTTDVPGQSWGFVTAFAQNGVKYYSPAHNYIPQVSKTGGERAALLPVKWKDYPFYWQSQSGKEKVLHWQSGKGYSWFHYWLRGKLSFAGIAPVWEYLTELAQEAYPYEITYMRYTIGGDNGPPDREMPDIIREWNEKYEYPRFVIGTTKELFESFEKKYGDHLPVFSGDMTPIWELGAASTARELAYNRASAERLNQAEILWSMIDPKPFPANDFLEAWKNVLLFSEHTWGAHTSMSEPESQFTKEIWEGKKMYADSADIQSKRLFNESLGQFQSQQGQQKFIQVFNTNLWSRTDVVAIEENNSLNGKILESASGELIPLQKLNDGRWIFLAKDVPPMSSAIYKIIDDKRKNVVNHSMIRPNVLDNGMVKLQIDAKTGVITSLSSGNDAYNYAGKDGLNNYFYSGRMLSNLQTVEQIEGITVLDDGEVAATLRVISSAPGCRSLWRDITVYKGLGRVDVVNTLDKLNIYEGENVRFAFPFNIDVAEITMDVAMSEMHPEREQMAGSNKNFYNILNGLSVNNLNHGVYLTAIDAPFIELGEMTAEDFRKTSPPGEGWMASALISPVIYSYVMGNTFEVTNYKASQEGVATFRYSIETFNPFTPALKKHGMEQSQKLVGVISDKTEPFLPLFRLKGTDKVAISTIKPSDDGSSYLLRLQSMSRNPVHASFEWQGLKPHTVFICSNNQQKIADFDAESFWLKPFECITLMIK